MYQCMIPCQLGKLACDGSRHSEVQTMDILIVEDDPVIGKAVHQGMKEAGHECDWFEDGARGLEAALSQKHQVVILDLLIPGESGLLLLEKLRRAGIHTPVIILTALG